MLKSRASSTVFLLVKHQEVAVAKKEAAPPRRKKLPSSLACASLNPSCDQGLKGQPTYDRNGVISASETPAITETGSIPNAIAGEERSVGPFKRLGPRFQVMDLLTKY